MIRLLLILENIHFVSPGVLLLFVADVQLKNWKAYITILEKIEIEFLYFWKYFAIFTGLKTIILSLYKVYDNLEMDAFLRFLKKEYMRCQHPCFWKKNIVVVTPSSSFCCSLSFTNYAEKFFVFYVLLLLFSSVIYSVLWFPMK